MTSANQFQLEGLLIGADLLYANDFELASLSLVERIHTLLTRDDVEESQILRVRDKLVERILKSTLPEEDKVTLLQAYALKVGETVTWLGPNGKHRIQAVIEDRGSSMATIRFTRPIRFLLFKRVTYRNLRPGFEGPEIR